MERIKGKIPKRRFEGFTDDWEQRKLSEVADFSKGNGYSKGDLCAVGTPIILYGRLYTKYETIIKKVDTFVIPKEGSVYSKGGEVIVPASGETAEDIARAVNVEKAGILLGGDLNIVTPNKDINSAFLALSISNGGPQKELSKKAQGKSVVHIHNEEIKGLEIAFPEREEQDRISTYFANLDHLITLHQRKLEKLKNIKKSYLSEMFPQEDEKKPKRRFKGFTDDWEQRKLLGCIQKITDFRGRTPKKLGMDWSESGYLALSALNVKDGYIDFMQDVHYGNQELYDKWMTGNELHKGQVLFTTEAPMGNVAQVPDNRQYILSQRTIAFDVKDDYITENFLATVLRTPKVFEDLTALSSGGTAKGVSQKSLAAVDIIIPTDLKEQEYIARYFANLNNLITLHQRKLEKLKHIKQAYLNEMFV